MLTLTMLLIVFAGPYAHQQFTRHFSEIQALSEDFDHLTYSFFYHEANRNADQLAKMGSSRFEDLEGSSLHFLSPPPYLLYPLVLFCMSRMLPRLGFKLTLILMCTLRAFRNVVRPLLTVKIMSFPTLNSQFSIDTDMICVFQLTYSITLSGD